MEEIILKVMAKAMTAEKSEKIVTGEKEYKKKSKTIMAVNGQAYIASYMCHMVQYILTYHLLNYKEGETEQ